MNKKGFTLVELLAVLALLAFVAVITVPLMDLLLDNSKKKTKDAQVKEIIEATKKYVIAYQEELQFDEFNESLLQLSDLKNTEFLDNKSYYNADTEEELNGCIYIKYEEEKYKYSYIYNCQSLDETTSETCFNFSNGTITGYNPNKTGCANPTTITFPTTIGGVKVKTISDPTSNTNDYLATAKKVDFTHAYYLEEIGVNAFTRTTGSLITVDEINLYNNSNLESIEESAFDGTSYLRIKNIIFPDNLTYIGHFAFRSNYISNVTFPQKLERIQEKAFYDNKIERIEIPSFVKTLGSLAFGKNKIITVTINSKANTSEFALYNNPFGENEDFKESKIIWKQ